MIKTLDEAIYFYKIKYEQLKGYDALRAEEYKQLYEWLSDYKKVKKTLNDGVEQMDKIINDYKSKIEEINNEKSEENNRWNMIYNNYTKNQIDDEQIYNNIDLDMIYKKLENNNILNVNKIKEL